jgi:hypothetical protein
MRIWQIAFLSILLAGCAAREIRCDGKLTAINPMVGKSLSQRDIREKQP